MGRLKQVLTFPELILKMAQTDRDFTIVKDSLIEGKGVFAKTIIPKGTRIVEYAGLRVPKTNLVEDLKNGLTSIRYIMNLNETTVIDGERNGNYARFINHSCAPNCEVYYFSEIPYIYAMREILPNEELSFDYRLGFDSLTEDISIEKKKEWFPCKCGASNCRGTLLAH